MIFKDIAEEYLKANKSKDLKKIFLDPKKGLVARVESINRYVDEDAIEISIIDLVKEECRNKSKVIAYLKDFTEWLKSSKNIVLKIDFPPIKSNSSFERRLFIVKYLQDPTHKIENLEDILWVSGRTIEDDIKALRGNNEKESIQICGKKLLLKESRRSNGKLIMSSTVHPVLLTSNLTQIIATLKGLRMVGKDPAFKAYSETQALEIWEQLSDYAKERIFKVVKDLLDDEIEWYQSLEEKSRNISDNTFVTERECSEYTKNVILECLKAEKPCVIEYLDTGALSSTFYEVSKILKYNVREDKVKVQLKNNDIIELNKNNIVSSAYTKLEII